MSHSHIQRHFPDPAKMPYYRELFAERLTFDDTLRAHLQDLARSLGCRGLREIQLEKLSAFCARHGGRVDPGDHAELRAVIEDELPVGGRPSHLDVRLQLFDRLGIPVESLVSVRPLPEAQAATRLFRELFTTRTALEITAAVGAVEAWYVPLAARLFESYRSIGYTAFEAETYRLHADADVRHSSTALGFVEKYAHLDGNHAIGSAVEQAFQSVRLFDDARFAAATDRSRPFSSFLTLPASTTPTL